MIPKHISSAQVTFRILTFALCMVLTDTTSVLLLGWSASLAWPLCMPSQCLPSQNPKQERREKSDFESLGGRQDLNTNKLSYSGISRNYLILVGWIWERRRDCQEQLASYPDHLKRKATTQNSKPRCSIQKRKKKTKTHSYNSVSLQSMHNDNPVFSLCSLDRTNKRESLFNAFCTIFFKGFTQFYLWTWMLLHPSFS